MAPHDGDAVDPVMLSAWLDDELDAAQRARVEAWLREHPQDAARVRLWGADRDALRARFDPVLAEPLPPALRRRLRPRTLAGTPLTRAAVVALLLGSGVLLGAGGMWRWQVQHPTGRLAQLGQWPQRAALAHAVYAPDHKHPVEVSAADEEHLLRWLSRRTALPLKAFDLRAQGFALMGGRLLPDTPGPAAQLLYEDAAGQRISLYLHPPEDAAPVAFRFEKLEGLHLYHWAEGGVACALVGTLPRERLLALAMAVYRQQGSAAPG